MSANDPILLQILQAVQTLGEDMQTVKSDIQELKNRSAQELTNAKLEGLTLDVRRVEGNLVRVEKKLEEETLDMRGEIRFLNHRVADLAMDVDKLKEKRL